MFRNIVHIASSVMRFIITRRVGLCFALVLLYASEEIKAQTNEWTWQGGTSINPVTCSSNNNLFCYQPGVYGTEGVPALDNIPSSRGEAATATDSKGNFWLFGGSDFEGQFNDLWKFDDSIQEWVWLNGSNTGTTPGVWGTLGVPAAGNIPSPRSNGVGWIDANGNFWLFGGYGTDSANNVGPLNDVWEYIPTTNRWAWMAGSNAFTCSYNSDYFKTLCVQPATIVTQGAFAAGNTPGGRDGEVTWTDSAGNFWLFGGFSYDSLGTAGDFNDLWQFSPSLNEWAWMGGASTITCVNWPSEGFCVGSDSPQPQYGTLGTPAEGNTPGGRTEAVGWTDSKGNVWVFGGTGQIVTGQLTGFAANFNDLWKFDPSTNEWAWMAGNATLPTSPSNFPGVYGTLGVPAQANTPSSRAYASGWTDSSGNFWLFGGWTGNPSTSDNSSMNDLWMFSPTTVEWTWMGGNSTAGTACNSLNFTCELPPIYGTLGTTAAGNNPGGRDQVAGWTDLNGNFWLFGGTVGYNDINFNDFWEYQPSANTLPPAVTPAFNPPAGAYQTAQTVTISNGMSNASIYYTTNGSTPTSNSTFYNGPVTVSQSETLEAIAVANGYPNSGVGVALYALTAATPTFSESGGTYSSAQSITLSDTTPGVAIYYTTNGSTPTTSSAVYSGAITVSATETIQAIAAANGYTSSPVASATYTILLPDFSLSSINPSSLTVEHGQSGNVTVTVTPVNGFSSAVSFTCSGLPAGASCSFNPTAVTPSGGSASTTLTVSTSSVATLRQPSVLFPGPAVALAFFCVAWRGKSRRRIRFASAMCLLGLVVMAGCGGSSGTSFTPITSTVTVTASSGSLQHGAAFTLNVQ
ncbi:MAG: chitobiase/beta-hexosaminidase C-terminal domain-containing protein [Terriglobales bacterium]|jgi:N-acetylneuraminic acid mutarotase